MLLNGIVALSLHPRVKINQVIRADLKRTNHHVKPRLKVRAQAFHGMFEQAASLYHFREALKKRRTFRKTRHQQELEKTMLRSKKDVVQITTVATHVKIRALVQSGEDLKLEFFV
jgi:cobyric acid synthase